MRTHQHADGTWGVNCDCDHDRVENGGFVGYYALCPTAAEMGITPDEWAKDAPGIAILDNLTLEGEGRESYLRTAESVVIGRLKLWRPEIEWVGKVTWAFDGPYASFPALSMERYFIAPWTEPQK